MFRLWRTLLLRQVRRLPRLLGLTSGSGDIQFLGTAFCGAFLVFKRVPVMWNIPFCIVCIMISIRNSQNNYKNCVNFTKFKHFVS